MLTLKTFTQSFTKDTYSLKKDLPASIVVFLVALPLCMGIAIASGVPPALGLITGIVGGIVVGFVTGAPLQVSGPAAGLTVLVYGVVQEFGLSGLGLAVLMCGLVQLLAGIFGLGRWFRAVSPSVIYGMLAGIGIIIFSSQFHVMVDDQPKSSALTNLLTIPTSVLKGFVLQEGHMTVHNQAAVLGLVTILTLILWNRFRPTLLKAVPGALIAVLGTTVIGLLMDFKGQLIKIPDNLFSAVTLPSADVYSLLTNLDFIHAILGLAAIASAETLLCATAVDKVTTSKNTTHYNQELAAQGFGNMVCGALGALPMTGVIVRSTANVEAGGQSRLSTILHGCWILLFAASLPFVLRLIPLASLAAILVYTGYKLVNFEMIKKLNQYGRSEVVIYASTVAGIVAIDLLVGVGIGLGLSFIKVIMTISRIRIEVTQDDSQALTEVTLQGAATVLTLPKLSNMLETLPISKKVIIHVHDLLYIDYACMDLLDSFKQRMKNQQVEVEIDAGKLSERIYTIPPPSPPSAPNPYDQKPPPSATARAAAWS